MDRTTLAILRAYNRARDYRDGSGVGSVDNERQPPGASAPFFAQARVRTGA